MVLIRIVVLFLSVLTLTIEGNAQVSFKANMTDSRLARLAKAKDARTKMQRYRKMYHRDSIRAMKARRKAMIDSMGRKGYKEYRDSVMNWRNYKGNINQIIAKNQSLRKLREYRRQFPESDEIKKFREEQKALRDSLGKEGYKKYRDSLKRHMPGFSDMLGKSEKFRQYQELRGKLPPKPDLKALDSLKGKISDDSLRILKKHYRLQYLKLDSLSRPALPDSLKGLEVMARYGMYGDMMKTYGIGQNVPTDSAQLVRYLALEETVKSFLPPELQQDAQFSGFKNQFGSDDMTEDDPAGFMLNGLPPEQKQAAMMAMSVLKKGYISVPNSNDLSSARKRTSLKGQGFLRRLHLGGNVAIQSFRPAIMDADFQLGYRFNRAFTVGTGFTIREQFDNQSSLLVGDAWGNSLFASHDLPFDIFAYAEYKRVKTASLFQENLIPAEWQQEINVGIGKELPVTMWLNLTAMVLYDLNFQQNNLHSRPIHIRFGYSISELALWKSK